MKTRHVLASVGSFKLKNSLLLRARNVLIVGPKKPENLGPKARGPKSPKAKSPSPKKPEKFRPVPSLLLF